MTEADTQKQLVKQLKLLNFWISLFGTLMLLVLGIIIFLVYQIVTFVQDTNSRIDSLRTGAGEALDLQRQVCSENSPLSNFLNDRTDYCK